MDYFFMKIKQPLRFVQKKFMKTGEKYLAKKPSLCYNTDT